MSAGETESHWVVEVLVRVDNSLGGDTLELKVPNLKIKKKIT